MCVCVCVCVCDLVIVCTGTQVEMEKLQDSLLEPETRELPRPKRRKCEKENRGKE